MPLARTYSVALIGVTGHVVEIEADIANGLPAVIVVGLPDTALREARDRIRAAITFPVKSACWVSKPPVCGQPVTYRRASRRSLRAAGGGGQRAGSGGRAAAQG